MRLIWLGLALWGAIHPMSYFLEWFGENSFDLLAMVDAWHANSASSGLVWDLTIAAICLSLWVVFEAIAEKKWIYLITIPATFMIGVSCGLPLFVYLRLQFDNR
ncbi:MAG: DUF2834 domain-containing protein [Roseobacter sp.]